MTPYLDPPRLARAAVGDLVVFSDAGLLAGAGIVIAFTTRLGGRSQGPYACLDLAGHTGDDPALVDENRASVLTALELDPARLITAEQVHGVEISEVGRADAGRGSSVASGRGPVPSSDALLTTATDTPLMMMYADCVPIVLVAPDEPRAVVVVHAGWRGAVARLPQLAAAVLVRRTGAAPDRLLAYIGPHIGTCHYEVSDDVAAAFSAQFGEHVRVAGAGSDRPSVDLGAAVRASLHGAGLEEGRVVGLDMCTAENTDLFYSYRAEGVTGRHGAIAAIR